MDSAFNAAVHKTQQGHTEPSPYISTCNDKKKLVLSKRKVSCIQSSFDFTVALQKILN